MTLPFSSEPRVPFFGGVAISMLLSPSGSGVGGSFPKPESGSVQDRAIETKPLTPTLAFFVTQVGEKFVAQSVLPSKWEATPQLDGTGEVTPVDESFSARSPAPKVPSV